jgi:hypothetical protein
MKKGKRETAKFKTGKPQNEKRRTEKGESVLGQG